MFCVACIFIINAHVLACDDYMRQFVLNDIGFSSGGDNGHDQKTHLLRNWFDFPTIFFSLSGTTRKPSNPFSRFKYMLKCCKSKINVVKGFSLD